MTLRQVSGDLQKEKRYVDPKLKQILILKV